LRWSLASVSMLICEVLDMNKSVRLVTRFHPLRIAFSGLAAAWPLFAEADTASDLYPRVTRANVQGTKFTVSYFSSDSSYESTGMRIKLDRNSANISAREFERRMQIAVEAARGVGCRLIEYQWERVGAEISGIARCGMKP